jgi:hypothetical protein
MLVFNQEDALALLNRLQEVITRLQLRSHFSTRVNRRIHGTLQGMFYRDKTLQQFVERGNIISVAGVTTGFDAVIVSASATVQGLSVGANLILIRIAKTLGKPSFLVCDKKPPETV